jgi:competence ComEA-like helix-hairpin-helix protein
LATKKKKEKKNSYFSKIKKSSKVYTKSREIKLHPFDPNMMTYRQWIEMGFSKKQAKNIENYKSKGGVFHKSEDFRKIYSISEDEFDRLYPYIIITSSDAEEDEEDEDEQSNEIIFTLKLNSINIDEIQKVKGIGPSYAKRIIKYRNLLGGYTQINQLMEVYGMDQERYQQIKPFFEIDTDSIQQLSLKTASYSQLLRHPYISKDLAYEITDYRKMHGGFKSVEELKTISIVNDSLYQKIYLYFAP